MGWFASASGSPPPRGLTGTILTEDEDSLTVAVNGRRQAVSLPRSAVTRMELSRQRSRRGAGAIRGALAGALIGAVAGYAAGDDCSGDEWLCFPHEQMAVAGIVVLAPIGAIVGALASPGEQWQEVPSRGLRFGAAPVPVRGGGFGLTVSVGF
jgi:hypothetical protein